MPWLWTAFLFTCYYQVSKFYSQIFKERAGVMHAKVWKTVFQESLSVLTFCAFCVNLRRFLGAGDVYFTYTLPVASSCELTVFSVCQENVKLCTLLDDIQREHFMQTDGRIICLFPYFLRNGQCLACVHLIRDARG